MNDSEIIFIHCSSYYLNILASYNPRSSLQAEQMLPPLYNLGTSLLLAYIILPA
jgi:hypothetical protein